MQLTIYIYNKLIYLQLFKKKNSTKKFLREILKDVKSVLKKLFLQ